MKKKPAKKKRANLVVDPEAFKAQLDPAWNGDKTPFREFIAEDNKRKLKDVDGRSSQEKQIVLLMDQLAEAKTGTATALDQVRLEEGQKTITALTAMNGKLMNIVELLATGIAKS